MLDDIKEWIWWALEMSRRTAKDWWSRGMWDGGGVDGYGRGKGKARGEGGEGIVLLVDAAGAGYRNLVSAIKATYPFMPGTL